MTNRKHEHISALDALRSFAMIGVLLFHAVPSKVSGGFLGVITFFVLSGFLSMRAIIARDAGKSPAFRPLSVFAKKLKKLMPELISMIFFTLLFLVFFLSEYLTEVKSQAFSSLLGINNIVQILEGESYFEAMAAVKPFTHIWALSMELQFYLIFLLTAGIFYRQKHRRLWIVPLTAAALTSFLLMNLLYTSPQEVTRIYYGTDTRIFSFLVGVVGALLFADRKPKIFVSLGLHSVLTFSLLFFSVLLFFFIENGAEVYRFVFLAYSLLQLLLIYLCLTRKTLSSSILGSPFFQMISARSYSIYLWHFPVMKLYEKCMQNTGLHRNLYILLELFIILAVSELAYRIFHPAKHGIAGAKDISEKRDSAAANAEERRAAGISVGTSAEKKRASSAKAGAKKILRLPQPKTVVLCVFIIAILFLPYRPYGEGIKRYENLQKLKRMLSLGSAEYSGSPQTSRNIGANSGKTAAGIALPPTSPQAAETEYREMTTTSPVTSMTESDQNTGIAATSDLDPEDTRNPSDSSPFSETNPTGETSEHTEIDTEADRTTQSTSPSAEDSPEIAEMREIFAQCKADFPSVNLSFEEYLKVRHLKMTLIGDSISVMVAPKLALFFPNIEISAQSNRQSYHAFTFYEQLKQEGRIGDIVILALGANGDINYDVFDSVRSDIGQRPLIITSIILPWPVTEAERNEQVDRYARERSNVYVIKWFEHCKNKPDILYGDGVHPIETSGAIAYAYVLAEAVYEAANKNIAPPPAEIPTPLSESLPSSPTATMPAMTTTPIVTTSVTTTTPETTASGATREIPASETREPSETAASEIEPSDP